MRTPVAELKCLAEVGLLKPLGDAFVRDFLIDARSIAVQMERIVELESCSLMLCRWEYRFHRSWTVSALPIRLFATVWMLAAANYVTLRHWGLVYQPPLSGNLWARTAALFCMLDDCECAYHRLMHGVPQLWRFRLVHHHAYSRRPSAEVNCGADTHWTRARTFEYLDVLMLQFRQSISSDASDARPGTVEMELRGPART